MIGRTDVSYQGYAGIADSGTDQEQLIMDVAIVRGTLTTGKRLTVGVMSFA